MPLEELLVGLPEQVGELQREIQALSISPAAREEESLQNNTHSLSARRDTFGRQLNLEDSFQDSAQRLRQLRDNSKVGKSEHRLFPQNQYFQSASHTPKSQALPAGQNISSIQSNLSYRENYSRNVSPPSTSHRNQSPLSLGNNIFSQKA